MEKTMKTIRSLLLVLILGLTFSDFIFAETTNSVPSGLRTGVTCDKKSIETALALKQSGWTYVMPEPKSPQAAWGHRDGRTTWWVGYWTNDKSHLTSAAQPKKNEKGEWNGDGNGVRFWR